MFAKLFGSDDNQVLVVKQEGNEGPEVRVFAQPVDLGVCSFSIGFSDDDLGWQKADSAFDKMSEADARGWVETCLRSVLGSNNAAHNEGKK